MTHDSPRLLEFFDLSQKNYLLGRGVYLIFTLKLAVLIIWYFTLKSYMQNTSGSSFLFYSARLTILILNQNSNDVMIHFIFISVSLYPAVLWCSILVWEVWSWPLPAASWILATELSLILVSFRLLSAKLLYNIVCPFSVLLFLYAN